MGVHVRIGAAPGEKQGGRASQRNERAQRHRAGFITVSADAGKSNGEEITKDQIPMTNFRRSACIVLLVIGAWSLVIPPASGSAMLQTQQPGGYMLRRYFTACEISNTGSSLSLRSMVR